MNYQSSDFGGEGSWNENIEKGLKVEIPFKIRITFLSFVKLYVVQKSKKVKLYLWIK